ncbi:MAG: hypothetical protein IT426_14275 [Pirellulales bacterium]|nr:hypothetical protein [Pirellulales bacterium]
MIFSTGLIVTGEDGRIKGRREGEPPVTAAINIAHEKTEREIDRKINAHAPAPHFNLDRVALAGKT